MKKREKQLGTALFCCSVLLMLAAVPASAAPSWLEPLDLSKPGRDATNPTVAMDGGGNTVAVWERQNTLDPSHNVQFSARQPGGTFSAPVEISLRSTEPDIAITPGGTAIAVWRHFENPPGIYVIQAAIRPPGGSFSPPFTVWVAPADVIPQELQVAANASGGTVVTWSSIDPNSGFDKVICENPKGEKPPCPNPLFVQASVGTPGGTFSTPVKVSAARGVVPPGETEKEREERFRKESFKTASGAQAAIDPAGNAIVVWACFDGVDQVIQFASRPAGGAFTLATTISEPGEGAGEAGVGVDAAGNAVATWFRNEGTDRRIQTASRPPGGSFGPVVNLSDAGAASDSPVVAMNEAGMAAVAWRLAGKSEALIQAAVSAPGGPFSAPMDVSGGSDNPLFPELALGANGDVVVAWSGDSGAKEVARSAVRPPGGAFSPPSNIAQTATELFHPHIAVDGSGDAAAVWTRSNGTHSIVQSNAFDAAVPQLSGVSIPSKGVMGDPIPFAASSSDFWPIGPPTIAFGDGGEASGNAVSHVYSAPGTYRVTVTAANAAGTAATVTGTIAIRTRGDFKVGKLKKRRRKGIGRLAVTVDGPGTLSISGKGVKKATLRTSKAGTVQLTIRAVGKSLKQLNEEKQVKLKVKVSFTPDGGPANVRQVKVTLVTR